MIKPKKYPCRKIHLPEQIPVGSRYCFLPLYKNLNPAFTSDQIVSVTADHITEISMQNTLDKSFFETKLLQPVKYN